MSDVIYLIGSVLGSTTLLVTLAVALVVFAGWRFVGGPIVRLVWKGIAFLPAIILYIASIPAIVLWRPFEYLADTIVSSLRLDTWIENLTMRHCQGAADPLLTGNRRAAAESRWPRGEFPFLYAPVPEDIERPLWEDGKLIGDYDVAWLADRHMTKGLLRSATVNGIAIGGCVGLLILFWAMNSVYFGPGPRALVVMLLVLVGVISFAFGVSIWAMMVFIKMALKKLAAPYEMTTKDAKVRWPYRAETRRLAHRTYVRQFELATDYLKDSPVLPIGTATGTLRTRGDLTAPLMDQVIATDVDSLFQHMIVFGGTGEGKTSALLRPLMRKLMPTGAGFFVCDAKGVLWKDAAAIAGDCNRRGDVKIIGTGDEQFGVNLLAGLPPVVVASVARSILRQIEGESKDSFWPDMASLVIRHVATIALAFQNTAPGKKVIEDEGIAAYSLWWIYRAVIESERLDAAIETCVVSMSDPKRRLQLTTDVSGRELVASIDYMTKSWSELAANTRSSITAFISQLLDGFGGSPTLRDRFASGTGERVLTLDTALSGKIVLNAVNSIEDGLSGRLVNMFLKTILYREARLREMRVGSEDCQQRPCFLIADEVQEIVTSDPTMGLSDVTFWNVARSAGVSGIFVTQTLAALIQAIGRDATVNFVQQSRSKVFFRSEDKETIEYACWIAGNQERNRVFDDDQRESVEQRHLLDNWTPFEPVDDAAEFRGSWRLLPAVGRAIFNLDALKPAAAGARRSDYAPDLRFLPSGETRAPGLLWDRVISITDAPIMSALQSAFWRSEDLEATHRSSGNELVPALQPSDLLSMGRWHAFAHIQRAGAARQDIISVYHDHDRGGTN